MEKIPTWIISMRNEKNEVLIIDAEKIEPEIFMEDGWMIEKDDFKTVEEAKDDAEWHGLKVIGYHL